MTTPTYTELRRLLAACHSRDTEPGELIMAEYQLWNALPGLLAEAEAGRKLRDNAVAESLNYLHRRPCMECSQHHAYDTLMEGAADYDREVGT